MIEQMKIGVALNLKGDAATKLRSFNDVVKRLNKTIEATNLKLEAMGQHFNKITTVLGRLNPAMLKFQENTGLIRQEFTGFSTTLKSSNLGLSTLNSRLRVSADNMRTTAESAAILRDSLEGVAASSAAAAGTAGGIGGRRGSGGGGHRRKGGGIHPHPLSFGGFGFSGGALAIGAGAILGYDSLKDYSKYQQKESQMILQNLSGFSQTDLTNYINNTHIRGTSNIGMLDYLTDAAIITKNYQEAKAVAPLLAMMSVANKVNYGQGFTRQQEMNLIRVAEIQTGSKDPAKLKTAFEHMMHTYNASGGRVAPTDYYAAAKGSRGAVRGYDPDYFYYFLEPLIQEYGGPTVGRMSGQFQQHMVAGRLTTAASKALDQLGLVKKGFAEYNKIGMIKRIKPGGIVGNELAQSDPAKWLYQYYLPALEKAGYKTTNQQHQMTNVIFTNTDSTLVSAILDQKTKLTANYLENQKAGGIDQSYNRALNTVGGRATALAQDTETLMSKMGRLMSGPASNFINVLDKTVRALTAVVDEMQKIDDYARKLTGEPVENILRPNPFRESKFIYNGIKKWFGGKDSSAADSKSAQGHTTQSQPMQGAVYLDSHQVGNFLFGSGMNQILTGQSLTSLNRLNASMSPMPHDAVSPY